MNIDKIRKHATEVQDLIEKIRAGEKALKRLHDGIKEITVTITTQNCTSYSSKFRPDDADIGEHILSEMITYQEESLLLAKKELETKVLLMPGTLVSAPEDEEIPF